MYNEKRKFWLPFKNIVIFAKKKLRLFHFTFRLTFRNDISVKGSFLFKVWGREKVCAIVLQSLFHRNYLGLTTLYLPNYELGHKKLTLFYLRDNISLNQYLKTVNFHTKETKTFWSFVDSSIAIHTNVLYC